MMALPGRRAALYRGMSDRHGMLSRWFRAISIEMWRRAARMMRVCLPVCSQATEFLFSGERDETGGAEEGENDVNEIVTVGLLDF